MISELAVVHPNAKIADNVTIGPFSVIEEDVEIGEGTRIASHVVVRSGTQLGKENQIYQFASIGEDPQHTHYHGEKTYLRVGDRNIIRECSTLHRGTGVGDGETTVGDDNLFMAYAHVAHDCHIGNHVIFTNNASIAGHVHVDDYVVMGGFAAVYQFCRLGKYCFVTGGSLVIKDVLPYTKISGSYAKPFGLNVVGLRRAGFDEAARSSIKEAYKIVYRRGLNTKEAISELEKLLPECPGIGAMISMLQTAKHGIVR